MSKDNFVKFQDDGRLVVPFTVGKINVHVLCDPANVGGILVLSQTQGKL